MSMDEKELERRLGELKTTWRIPRDPPLEQIWQAVEAKAFPAGAPQHSHRWTRTLLPLAATLLFGFGLGQLTPALIGGRGAPATELAAGAPLAAAEIPVRLASDEAPFVGIATNYLEQVTALLVTLADAARRGQSPEYSAGKARDLLSTTRLLIDSPQAGDPRLRQLLEDLELVLAQVVRLPRQAPQPDVFLIDQTLDQREVLPRLREILAENSTSQP